VPVATAAIGQFLEVDAFDPMTGAVVSQVSLASLPDVEPVAAALAMPMALTLEGDCMAPTMSAGDILFVRRDRPARRGRSAAVKLRGKIPMVKRWWPEADCVWLVPTNPKYAPIQVPASEVEWALEVLLVVRFRVEGAPATGKPAEVKPEQRARPVLRRQR
jgi:hypothetical protein